MRLIKALIRGVYVLNQLLALVYWLANSAVNSVLKMKGFGGSTHATTIGAK